MGLFKKDVTNDQAVITALKAVELLINTENPDYPMLQLTFNDTNITVLYVEGGNGAPVTYQKMRQAGGIDEETCNMMIGRCIHADQLPSNFKIEFKYEGNGGECDSYNIIGIIPTEHRKAQKEYIAEISRLCGQRGIKHKVNKSTIGFLNWA